MSAVRRTHTLIGTLALACAALVVALLLAEGALAVVDFPPRLTDHQRLLVEYDPVRGWRNVAHGRARYVTTDFSVTLEYNERSYRGPLHAYPKPQGTFRVLLLGDSYLEGYTVSLKDRAPEVAAALLEKRGHTGPVEVIALGTAGYSTDQELLWLEREGLRYSPDLVVLLLVDNDYVFNIRREYPRGPKPVFQQEGDSLVLRNVPVPRVVPASGEGHSSLGAIRRFLAERSRLYDLARRAVRRTAWLQALGARLGLLKIETATVPTSRGAVTVPEEYVVFADRPSLLGDSAMRMTASLLSRMRRSVEERDARLVVMHVPANEAVYPPGAQHALRYRRESHFGDPGRSGEVFLQVCQLARVACVDPTPRFVEVADSLSGLGALLVFPEDEHWSEHGHRVAGAVIADIAAAAIDTARPSGLLRPAAAP